MQWLSVAVGPGARSPVHAPGARPWVAMSTASTPVAARQRRGDLAWDLRPHTRTTRPASIVGAPTSAPPAEARGGGGARGRRPHARSPPSGHAGQVLKPRTMACLGVAPGGGPENTGTAGALPHPQPARPASPQRRSQTQKPSATPEQQQQPHTGATACNAANSAVCLRFHPSMARPISSMSKMALCNSVICCSASAVGWSTA
jgi:hypothetical protein